MWFSEPDNKQVGHVYLGAVELKDKAHREKCRIS